jgi:hypothetical protein
MAQQNQPLTLKMNGSGAQTQTNPDGTPLGPGDRAQFALIITPQAGPAVPVTPAGTPLDMTVAVLTPYSLTTPPGVIPG